MNEILIDRDDSDSLIQSIPLAPTKRGWVVCLCASLFLFYEFIQMNMFNAISPQLMQEFHVNASQLGRISSYYFISNVIFLFPAGLLLDRYSIRHIILITFGICIFGTIAFSCCHTITEANFCRFLTGIGDAFCFLGAVRLATRWFPSTRLALVTGIIVTIAMLGGVAAQTPLLMLTQIMSWRSALLCDASLGIVIFILIVLTVRDYPLELKTHYQREKRNVQQMGYWKSMGLAFLKFQNWLGGVYTCLMNLPISLLGGIWGVLYLVTVQHLSQLQATYVTTFLFMGTIIGSPLSGWISDFIGLRRKPMIVGTLCSLVIIFLIMFIPHLNVYELAFLFFALGFTTSTQIIAYPTVAENSLPSITAMSVSTISIATMGGQGIFHPFFGILVDHHAKLHHESTSGYIASDVNWAMWIFPICFVVALLAAVYMRETYCKNNSN